MRKYTKQFAQGFTLIELLVVIAIIGILSAVVLPSLNTARQKGQIAAFEAEMASLRSSAEVYYTDASSYTGMFLNDPGASTIATSTSHSSVQNILSSIATRASDGVVHGLASGDAYAVYARIPGTLNTTTTAADIYCVDNAGHIGVVSADPTDQLTDAPVSVCW